MYVAILHQVRFNLTLSMVVRERRGWAGGLRDKFVRLRFAFRTGNRSYPRTGEALQKLAEAV